MGGYIKLGSSDRVDLARRKAGASGLNQNIRWFSSDFAYLEKPAAKGALICNPPYGERLGDVEALVGFYGKFTSTKQCESRNMKRISLTSLDH